MVKRKKPARRSTLPRSALVCVYREMVVMLAFCAEALELLRLRLVPMCLSGLFPAAVERRTRLHGLASHGCPSAL